ncbi:nicotinate-nucleotide--dimethylbenzimidazole phosphoribosyltransferase [Streptomyces sp. NPDC017941]|uniref:nicotinate-nucleotide--dimethylbenzimidazole phosphoribosyltransferase n=1 Tax=Streptomyces sp. NPDC017941 TaxID=3365018 RepID=UPI0037B98458
MGGAEQSVAGAEQSVGSSERPAGGPEQQVAGPERSAVGSEGSAVAPGQSGVAPKQSAVAPGQSTVGQARLAHQPGPHETSGRDSGSVDLTGVTLPGGHGTMPASHDSGATHQSPVRRPLHRGPAAPAVPDGAASPVRSLADRGPANGTPHRRPVRQAGPPTSGPEYLDVPRDDAATPPAPQLGESPPQGAVPWSPQPQETQRVPAETVVPVGAGDSPATQATPVSVSDAPVPDASGAAAAGGGSALHGGSAPVGGSAPAGVPTPADGSAPVGGGTDVAEDSLPADGATPGVLADGSDSGDASAEGSGSKATPADGSSPANAPADGSGPVTSATDGSAPAPATSASVNGADPASATPAPGAPEASEAPAAEGAPQAPAATQDPAPAYGEQPAHAPQEPAAAMNVPGTGTGSGTGPGPDAGPGTGDATATAIATATATATATGTDADAVTGTGDGPDASPATGNNTDANPAPSAPTGTDPGRTPAGAPATPPVGTPDVPDAADQGTVAPPSAPEPATVTPAAPTPAPAGAAPLPHEAPAAPAAAGNAAGAAPGIPGPHAEGQAGTPAHPAPQYAVAPQAPDAAQPWPEAHTAQGPHIAGAGLPDAAAGQALAGQAPAPLGQFVPVDGSVPTAPHLAPTPSSPMAVPPEYHTPEPEAATGGPGAPAPQTAEADQDPAAVPANGLPGQAEAAPDSWQGADSAPDATPDAGQQPAATVPAPRDGDRPTAVPAGAAPAPVDAAEDGSPFPSAPATTDPDEPMHAPHPAGPTDPAHQAGQQPVPALLIEDGPEDLSDLTDLTAPAAPADADDGPQALLLTTDAADPAAAADTTDEAALREEAEEPGADGSVEPPAPGYADAEREAVLRVMRERRDIRHGFRGDPIPHEVLLRVLEAAHTAPSVGHSQPWDFVVIRSAETRRTMHELAQRQREAYAKSLPKGRAKQFKELKIEAILDTPVNIVVTADPTRGGRHTLGRHTQPQMAPYSSALAVENLWLAARAEGLGVGWVSFFDEREMVRALGLPEHLEVVAYLCVGYVDEFPDEPELMQAGWSKRRPLSWVVHEETYGRRALPGEEPHDLLAETVGNIRPLDAKALGEAWERQKRMTKPAGALGMLEIISAQLSGLSRMCPPPIPEPAAVAIFAGDHGVHAQGVTSWPQEVTGQMVANFLGGGAVCNAFANQVGAEVCVIDVGVAGELPATPGLLPRKIRPGTADMTTGPALTREEVQAAIEVGIETARDLVAAGNKALLTGEMGIANTTASAALISVYTDTDPVEVTGRGTGINDDMHARKVEVVRRALDLHQPDPADPVGVLAAIGGLEHAAMVGLLLGGASLRTPVILDGVSAGAAALVARAIAPEVLAACIAGHRSAEPGHVAALNKLGLRPLVDLDLRLGEGTGALLALPVVQSAARAMHEVATFDSAGVTEK